MKDSTITLMDTFWLFVIIFHSQFIQSLLKSLMQINKLRPLKLTFSLLC